MSSIIIYSMAVFLVLYILLEIRLLLRNRDWKQLIISSLLMGISLFYGVDYAIDLKILPNPNKALYLVKPVSENFERLLQTNER